MRRLKCKTPRFSVCLTGRILAHLVEWGKGCPWVHNLRSRSGDPRAVYALSGWQERNSPVRLSSRSSSSLPSPRTPRVTALAQRQQIVIVVRSTIAQRHNMMNLSRGRHPTLRPAVLTQRVSAQVHPAYPSPSRIVATSRRRRAARLRIPGMGGAVPPVGSQGRAAGVTAWAGGGSRHRATPAHG